MVDNCGKKTLLGGNVLWNVAFVMLSIPTGALVGILFGLLTDFGFGNTVESMRANPQIFADQYSRLVVCNGWIALVSLAVLFVVVGIQFFRTRQTKRVSDIKTQ
jgi:hypothetical protein